MDELDRRNEGRKLATAMNAEAVVALIERQEQRLREYDDVLAAQAARISVVEQQLQQMKADEFVRQAQAMNSGPTV